MSSALFASPIDARTAPTAVLVHWANRSGVKFVPRPARQAAMRVGSSVNADSDAPGLQKQPPRSETFARRARVSTRAYGSGVPVRSQTLNATAAPHAPRSRGP